MFGLGTPEILLILLVMLMFFGKDKLPELARSIGKSARELKAGFEKPLETTDSLGSKKEVDSATGKQQV
jgi:sec-independent protein translocase protein TatA